jgi:hypothetical protein
MPYPSHDAAVLARVVVRDRAGGVHGEACANMSGSAALLRLVSEELEQGAATEGAPTVGVTSAAGQS